MARYRIVQNPERPANGYVFYRYSIQRRILFIWFNWSNHYEIAEANMEFDELCNPTPRSIKVVRSM